MLSKELEKIISIMSIPSEKLKALKEKIKADIDKNKSRSVYSS